MSPFLRLPCLAACLLLTLTFFVACSSSSAPAPPYTQEQFASDLCGVAQSCCSTVGLQSLEDCSGTIVHSLEGLPSWDPVSAHACIGELTQAAAASGFCGASPSTPDCTSVFQLPSPGTVAAGQACAEDSDCAVPDGGAASCFEAAGGGTCVSLPPGTAGDDCLCTVEGSVTSCGSILPAAAVIYSCDVADGLSCDTSTATCIALSATMGTCAKDLDCAPGDYCDFGDPTQRPAECLPRVAAGAACGTAGPECQAGSFCDPASSTCKSDASAGWICANGTACLSGSCTGGVCRGGFAPIVCSSTH
ncbi:MAG TPA: hypothetical protein VGL81_04855 [Polyangiaceae bacterium]|jgi:hypothetical protein